MATLRYDLGQEVDGTWTVYDVFTGSPTLVLEMFGVGMSAEEANDLVDLLNNQDLRRRGRLTRSP
ncbi:hypothetical protein FHS20_001342 [Phyllobacterium endophyticum]|uniref:Uncharacterized protein n=1 Tax=Phyllobacterium endophyticum TaxID=1149773 RepID=A0A2P7AUV7_9HYPH|nr:hypothetical protein [Phyllobacterium endophyticum]PSH57995.1 hypothetical protein CU100_10005 [Phyllobacterium endophyticum]TYR38663.1 hypothetical protein FY050_21975 [Phyllobacterium endophyticum]